MVSDWDVLTMISTTINELSCPLTIKHVKGHQDEKKAYKDLTILAQLNVDADKLAGSFQTMYGMPRPTVLRFPVNSVQFNLHTTDTVTYKLKSVLYHEASAPALRDYIAERNGWDDQDMQLINWKAHASAISRKSIPHNHTVKLIHDILPTNSQVNLYEPHRSPKCPYCWADPEDRDHIIRCPHDNRKLSRTKMITALTKRLSTMHTEPTLQTILLDGIQAWVNQKTIGPSNYPKQFRKLILQQNRLGWRQLFNGRLSQLWTQLQHQHLIEHALVTKRQSGHQWTVSVITSLWTSWHLIWEDRNQRVHGHDATTRSRIQRERAIAELQLFYDRQNLMLPVDRNFFMDTAETHSQKPTYSIINWLNTYRGLFTASLKTAKKNAVQHTKSISTFFTRRPRAVPD